MFFLKHLVSKEQELLLIISLFQLVREKWLLPKRIDHTELLPLREGS